MAEHQGRFAADVGNRRDRSVPVDPALLWLLGAAALTVAVSALTEQGGGTTSDGWPLLSLFLLWRVWRGGHVAWVVSASCATVGALVFTLSATSHWGVPAAPALALLHMALAAVLLGRPVRRLVGRAA